MQLPKEILDVLGKLSSRDARIITDALAERQHTEAALRESESRLTAAQQMAHLGHWYWDVKTGDVTWSKEVYEIFRLDPETFTPQIDSILELSPWPEDHERDKELIEKAIRSREQGAYEQRFLRPDGSVGYYDSTFQGVYDDSGLLTAIKGTVQDITVRKRAELELENAISMLHDSQEAANIGTWWVAIPEVNVHWTPQVFRIFGLDPSQKEPTLDQFFEFVHPDDSQLVKQMVQEQLADLHGVSKYFYRIVLPDGETRTLEHVGRPIRNSDNELVRLVGTIQDITDRERAQDELNAERERLAVTLRSIGDGVITTDTDGKILMINRVAEGLTGWQQDEAFGMPLELVFNTVHEGSKQPRDNPVSEVMTSGRVIELANHTVLIARDGCEHIISDSGAPIKDQNGVTIGVVLVFRDMTEKRKIQQTIQRSARLDSLAVLAGGIAHDFNNLLGGIFGYIDMATERSAEPHVKNYLEKSLDAIDRARGLTMQLLTFAKGGAPVKKIGLLFPFIKETAKFALSGSNISCKFEIEDQLWSCDYDRSQLGQVVENLTINAQQAMPLGGTIHLKAKNEVIVEGDHPLLGAGNYVKLSIQDAGIGIPKEMLSRVFDPFFTTKPKGHGLGLATCYSIINRHGGCIEVESEQGRGTAVHIHLPAAVDAIGDPVDEAQPTTHIGRGTVLIMDDEEVMRDMVSAMLSSLGYDVACKTSGEETLDYLSRKSIANRGLVAMILDLTIPGGIGGKETVAEIRKIDKTIPVLVTSGYSEDPVMANPSEYGFTASIRKPFRKAELVETLSSVLQKNGTQ